MKTMYPSECPPNGWTVDVTTNRVIDGDTIECSFMRTFIVRFIDFDAPETTWRASCDAEREHGVKASEFLEDLLKKGQTTLFIPSSQRDMVHDLFSIGSRIRAVPYVDGKNVIMIMNENDMAKRNDYTDSSDETRPAD